MKKLLLLLTLLSLLLFNCAESSIQLKNPDQKTNKENSNDKTEIDEKEDGPVLKELTSLEFAYLFFRRGSFSTPTPKAYYSPTPTTAPTINPSRYRVIVNYQVEGEEIVKLKDLQTGIIYDIPESRKKGDIVLMAKTHFYYTFKINNQVVKVKR